MTFEELMNAYYIDEDRCNAVVYEELLSQLKTNRITPVIGAGLSKWAHYPLWRDLLLDKSKSTDACDKIKQLIDNEKYEAAATCLEEEYSRNNFLRMLQREFSPQKLEKATRPPCQQLLKKLFKGLFVTTNYDVSLEQLLHPSFIVNPQDPFNQTAIETHIQQQKHGLIKLHGTIDDPGHMVLTEATYNSAYGSNPDAPDETLPLPQTLKLVFQSAPPLFLGCGLGTDRTCTVFKRCRGATGFALVEMPEMKPSFKDDFKKRMRQLDAMNLQIIWDPHKQHDAVEVLLAQLAGDLGVDDPLPNPPPPLIKADTEATQYFAESFFGRKQEVAEIIGCFQNDAARTVLVHGAPGIGKTEVCKAVYRELRAADPHFSMPFVDVADAAGIEDIAKRIADALGMPLRNDIKPEELFDLLHHFVCTLCQNGARYLYLDNYEELHNKLSDRESVLLCERLKKLNAAGLRLLISSQMDLSLGQSITIRPLDKGQPVTGLPWDAFLSLDQVQLFCKKLGRKPRQDEHADLVTLMQEIGGHPLALVLAATYGRTCGSIAELLNDWNEIEIVHSRQSHQSLRRALMLAWNKVQQNKAAVFLWAVHANSVLPLDTDAIKHLNAALPEPEQFSQNELREGGRKLRQFGLLDSTDDGKEQMLLSVKKTFALLDDTAKEASSSAFSLWITVCGDLLEQGDDRTHPEYLSRHDKALALLPQCFALAERCLDRKDYEALTWLLHSAYNYYMFDIIRSAPLLQKLLREKLVNFPLRAGCYSRLGDLFCLTGQIKDAQNAYDHAKQICQKERNILWLANVLLSSGNLFYRIGQLEEAQRAYDEAEQLYRQEQHTLGLANVLQSRGNLFYRIGQLEDAQKTYDEAEQLYRQNQNPLGLANVLQSRGKLLHRIGQLEDAQKTYDEAEQLYQQVHDVLGLANVLRSRGDLYYLTDQLKNAQRAYRNAEQLYRQEQHTIGLANVLLSRGDLFRVSNQLKEAQYAYDEAERLYRQEQHTIGLANVLLSRGDLFQLIKDWQGAAASYEQALPLYRQEQDSMGLCYTLSELLLCQKILGDDKGYRLCLRELKQHLPLQPNNIQEQLKERIALAETLRSSPQLPDD